MRGSQLFHLGGADDDLPCFRHQCFVDSSWSCHNDHCDIISLILKALLNYNVQLTTTTDSQIIVGVEVNNCGSDLGQLSPMLKQVEQRYEQCPAEWLADGGFARNADIEDAHRRDTTVYAPVRHPRNSSRDPHVALPDDSEAIIQWRQRMGSKAAKEIYKQRAATAECVNAIARGRGLTQFLVRGLNKVKAVALWYALAHNLMRSVTLVQPA